MKKRNFRVEVFKKDRPALNILIGIAAFVAVCVGVKYVINTFSPEPVEDCGMPEESKGGKA